MDYESYIIDDQERLDLIKEALLSTYFSERSTDFIESEWDVDDINANVFVRYNHSLKHIVPWVSKQIDLSNKVVVEIGCGTGSSTAAFAHFVDKIVAYDIDEKSIEAAKKRMDIMELKNAEFNLVQPESLAKSIINEIDEANIFLLFAVLEHMTVEERQETIINCWDLLPEEGLLVIVETPNLLQYFDWHTSVLPFFHFLDSDLCAKYSIKSPRKGFNDDFSGKVFSSVEKDLKMTRWGRGISYHDFELTLGDDYDRYLVSNGFEPEILSWFGVNLEEEVLRYYVSERNLDIPSAFTRSVLNLIFKKEERPSFKSMKKPPPFKIIFNDEIQKIAMEKEVIIANQKEALEAVQNCFSYKLGTLLTSPYRMAKKIFKN